MCRILPEVILKVVNNNGNIDVPQDVVYDELVNLASLCGKDTENIGLAIYMLGFNTYNGFVDSIKELDNVDDTLKRMYEYVKRQGGVN